MKRVIAYSLAIGIPLFMCIVFMSNPDFGERWFMTAVAGMYLFAFLAILGIPLLYVRKRMRDTPVTYRSFGLLYLVAGLFSVIASALEGFQSWQLILPFELWLLGIGIFFLVDLWRFEKRHSRENAN